MLPEDKKEKVRDICDHVRYRLRVYQAWGFERRSLGKGIGVLFLGPSRTVMIMAPEVIAKELRLPMYKIDLSTVVSKYIGETEKNFTQVFDAAEDSNAILSSTKLMPCSEREVKSGMPTTEA